MSVQTRKEVLQLVANQYGYSAWQMVGSTHTTWSERNILNNEYKFTDLKASYVPF